MGCQYLEDLYELYLLGTLGEEDSTALDGHLERGCPSCLEGLHEAALIICLLTQTVRPARLNSKHKSRLLRRLRKKP